MDLNLPLETELLSAEELAQITGRSHREQQMRWLTENDWQFYRTAGGSPIVGRLYARFKLAGIDLSALAPASGMVHWDKINKLK